LEKGIEEAREGLRQLFDIDVNGSDKYYALLGAEIERYPLRYHRTARGTAI
jgi:hypothetical protein